MFIIIDDCVATGGSLRASIDLFERENVTVTGCLLILTIPECFQAAITRFHDKELISII